jgi:hypothetical protein
MISRLVQCVADALFKALALVQPAQPQSCGGQWFHGSTSRVLAHRSIEISRPRPATTPSWVFAMRTSLVLLGVGFSITLQNPVSLGASGSTTNWVEIANSEQDFSLTQGLGGWTYGYARGFGEPAPVELMAFASFNPGCGCGNVGAIWHFAAQLCFCGGQFCFQGATVAHPGTNGEPRVPVRTYTFPQTGVYRLRPTFFHAGGCQPAEDIRLEMRFRGQVIWSAETDGGPQTGEVIVVAQANERVELWSVMLLGECGTAHVAKLSVDASDCTGSGGNDLALVLAGSLPDYDGDFVPDTCELGNYAIQWRSSMGGNGHWYEARSVGASISWHQASVAANSSGGHLATITSESEYSFVWELADYQGAWSGRSGPWLGGYQDRQSASYAEPAGGWRWVTDEAWFPRWGVGEPNNTGGVEDYLHFIGETCSNPIPTRHLNDFAGNAPFNSCTPIPAGYIIEWSADCNSDGIVDYGQIRSGQLRDADGNGVPNICQCPGDVTGNQVVNGLDLSAVLSAWGTSGQGEFDTDINRDGTTDAADLTFILSGWGPCP